MASISRIPGPPLGPFVADHDNIAGRYGAILQGIHRCPFAVEDPRRALPHLGVETGALDHRTFRCQRATQDCDAAGGMNWIVQRPHDRPVHIRRGDVGEVLGHGLARDSQAISIE
jgi:hypothetical protein